MPDQAALTMAGVLGKKTPALSATTDMPTAPPLSEEKVKAEEKPPEKSAKEPEKPEPKDADKPEEKEVTAEGEKPDEKPKDETPPWAKAEITKERNRRRAEKERGDRLEEQLSTALKAIEKLGGDTKTAKVADADDPRPRRDAFESPDAYDTALDAWYDRKTARVMDARDEQRKVESDKAAQQTRNAELAKGFEQSRAKAIEKYPDFEEVAEREDVQISQTMGFAILNAGDAGRDVQYWLGKNPEEAARIAQLSPPMQIFELGRLFASQITKKPAVSKAPVPINPIRGGTNNAGEKSADEMSMEEYAKNHPLTKAREKAIASGRVKAH